MSRWSAQALLVEPCVEQPRECVEPGRRRRHRDGVEDPPEAGDGSLHPHPSGRRRDQVGAADNDTASQPTDVGGCPEPTGGLRELPGPDRVLTDEHDLGVPLHVGPDCFAGITPQ